MAEHVPALSRVRLRRRASYDGRVRWFGKSWGAPVCDPRYHVETPLGEVCLECAGAVVDGDQGLICACDPSIPNAFWWYFAGDEHSVCAYHVACFEQSVFGNVVNREED